MSDILNRISYPSDLKSLSIDELVTLCNEIRDYIIQTVSVTGGHLGASLGVIELSVAIHYVFNTPQDRIVWDIGHQTYPHKILTGRKNQMSTIRKPGGLSGFTNIFESEYDPFGAGHSSTSISAALGMLAASKIRLEIDKNVIAIIGDSAISAGIAYEALNNASEIGKRLIVILNDNDMSISRPTGAISKYLPKLKTSKSYNVIRNVSQNIASKMNSSVTEIYKKAEKSIKEIISGSNIFEDLGFRYLGPIDGHNLKELITILENVKQNYNDKDPVLIHLITKKGNGYPPAENSEDKFHGVSSFDITTGKPTKHQHGESFSELFSKTLTQHAKDDPSIVAITAAMPSGTCLDIFAKELPERFFDVGIAEQHAITFAAGLAKEGLKPYCVLYSTFLQRGYDQLIHDVCIQKLPVRFGIDRSGFVGSDGPTHNGVFDNAFLSIVPNITICQASDTYTMQKLIEISTSYQSGPFAIKYAKANATPIHNLQSVSSLKIGSSITLTSGTSGIAIITLGSLVQNAITAHKTLLQNHNISITVVDAVFIKPIDEQMLTDIAKNNKHVIVYEEASIGGFASRVLEFYNSTNLLTSTSLTIVTIQDQFIEQNTMEEFYKSQKMDSESMLKTVLQTLS